MKFKILLSCFGAVWLVLAFNVNIVQAAEAPFGGPQSIEFGKKLWIALEKANLVGNSQIRVKPYVGTEPHGFVLESIDASVMVEGRKGRVVVKRNYGPKGVGVEAVEESRAKHLAAVTVMFKREKGYDSDNLDWFWAKYKKDGSIDNNPKGAKLVGRVAKGKEAGCIACHKGAPGEDMVFLFD
jgi:hypothetical protein